MELRQLRYVEAVARHGGFTRAAERLHVAQSAVSAQVRALEREIGAELFTRTTRRVSLTAAGEVFLRRARRVLDEIDGARGDLAELAAVLTGRVTVGATAVLGDVDLPAHLARFHRRHPGVGLSLRSGLIADLLAGLDTAEIDLVVGPVHDGLPERYAARRIARESVVLALPPGHHRARSGPVPVGDLRDEPFVCLPLGSGLRAILDEAAGRAGFRPRVPFEAPHPAAMRDLVSAGLGVAFLARSAAVAAGPPIEVRALSPAPPHPVIAVLHRRDRRLSPAARALAQLLGGWEHQDAPIDAGGEQTWPSP